MIVILTYFGAEFETECAMFCLISVLKLGTNVKLCRYLPFKSNILRYLWFIPATRVFGSCGNHDKEKQVSDGAKNNNETTVNIS